MIIESIRFYLAKIPLKTPFITALSSRKETQNIFVVMQADNGLVGYGECCPYPGVLGETAETAMLIGERLAQVLVGQDPRELAIMHKLMDGNIFGNTGIKAAIDIACHDLWAKSCDEPLFLKLGGQHRKTIKTNMTISLAAPETMAEKAKEAVAAGFDTLKIKLGKDEEEDLTRVKEIRNAVGTQINLRVDANQAWKVKEAARLLQAMESLQIQYCEEPISRRKVHKLHKVRKVSPIKIMADESLIDHYDAQMLIKNGACDYFNLKLDKSAGLFKAQKIVDLAEIHHIPMQMGCFLNTRLSITAACHLAYSSEEIKFYDLDSPFFQTINPVRGGVEIQKNGEMRIPDQPGLGLSLDENFLKTCQSIIVQV